MDLSITADYVKSHGCPQPYLQRIATAGFSHVHWAYHYNTDFLYSRCEIEQIAAWLDEYGLKLLDLHASHGVEKNYLSALECERLAGVELIENRMEMAARLGSDVIILHIPAEPGTEADKEVFHTQLRKSLDTLRVSSARHGVRIAAENLFPDNFALLDGLFDEYEADFLGLCYDAGHDNIESGTFEGLRALKERLISVHLHDNQGTADDHNLVFSGTVDWSRLAEILAASTYDKCVSLEVMTWHAACTDEEDFLVQAHAGGRRLSAMIEAARSQSVAG
jgi:sugar phosphate isomerase/epimerase